MATYGFTGIVTTGRAPVLFQTLDATPAKVGQETLEWARGQQRGEHWRTVALSARSTKLHNGGVRADFGWQNQDLPPGMRAPIAGEFWEPYSERLGYGLGETLDHGHGLNGQSMPFDARCEWGYLIDLMEEKFEVYMGFQFSHHAIGRFGHSRISGTVPVKLAFSWYLDALPTSEEMVAYCEHKAVAEWGPHFVWKL